MTDTFDEAWQNVTHHTNDPLEAIALLFAGKPLHDNVFLVRVRTEDSVQSFFGSGVPLFPFS
jgi:hypothetical protein